MFGSQRQVATGVFYDPAGTVYVPILKAPTDSSITIEAGAACISTDVATHADNTIKLSLYNGGTTGVSTDIISDEIGGTVGWTAATQKAFTVVDGSGKLDAGEWLVALYKEAGAVAPVNIIVSVEYVTGVGDKA